MEVLLYLGIQDKISTKFCLYYYDKSLSASSKISSSNSLNFIISLN